MKKILNNLKKHYKIPHKFLSKIEFIINKKRYDKNYFENQQNKEISIC